MIVSLYQCDPEFRLYQQLQKYLDQTGLEQRGINTQNLVMQGHPLFELQASGNKQANDNIFPRIGIDLLNDMDEDQNLGENYRLVHSSKEHKLIEEYKQHGGCLLDQADVLSAESNYEQISFKKFDEILSYNGYLEKYTLHNMSMVQITGWTSGAHARKTSQWLYMAVKSVIPFVVTEIKQRYLVNVKREGRPETNIINTDMGHNLHGFEIMLSVSQIITVYRTLPDYTPPSKADIYANGSRTKILADILN